MLEEARTKATHILDDAQSKADDYKHRIEADLDKKQVVLNGLKEQLELLRTALNKRENDITLKEKGLLARENNVAGAENRIALAEKERDNAVKARD